jgi:hypothetical protein
LKKSLHAFVMQEVLQLLWRHPQQPPLMVVELHEGPL